MRAYILRFDIYDKKFKKVKSQKLYDDDEVGKIELCELGRLGNIGLRVCANSLKEAIAMAEKSELKKRNSLACYTMTKEKQ